MHCTDNVDQKVMSTYRFCVAPMMDGTDRHCRFFHRQLSRKARLYTEMVTAPAILHGDREWLLGFDPDEHPVALQLGGSDPQELAAAAKIGADVGYDEINLNVGCPSDRVQSGTFGACLMKTPDLVAECVAAMQAAVSIPVTIKSRIGVDDQDPEESLFGFVETVRRAGCSVFIVHARKAWLQGLSPKENRTVPPLDYDIVYRLKKAHPDCTIVLNGGLENLTMCNTPLEKLDGVMLGRAPYARPWLLHNVDEQIFSLPPSEISRSEVIRIMSAYIREHCDGNRVRPHAVTRHMLGLFHGTPGARLWRQTLSGQGARTPVDILDHALELLEISKNRAAEKMSPSLGAGISS